MPVTIIGTSGNASKFDGKTVDKFMIATGTSYIGNYIEKVQVIASSTGTQNISSANGNIVKITITGNSAINLSTGETNSGTSTCLTMFMVNGGSFIISWGANIKWDGGSAPTLSTTGTDMITFITIDNGATWYGLLNGVFS